MPTDDLDDNAKLVEHLDGLQGWIWAYQTTTFLLAVLVVIFGLGLRRRLAGQAPTGSILPDVAAAGMLLVAALLLVGGGISTEMFHSVRNIDDVDPDTLARPTSPSTTPSPGCGRAASSPPGRSRSPGSVTGRCRVASAGSPP